LGGLTVDALVPRISCGFIWVGFLIWLRGEDGGGDLWTSELAFQWVLRHRDARRKKDLDIISILLRGPFVTRGCTELVPVVILLM